MIESAFKALSGGAAASDSPARLPRANTRASKASLRHSSSGLVRPVCQYGTRCTRKNPDHMKEYCHPADNDYHESCRTAGKPPEFISIRRIFEWCDPNAMGKATREELENIWPQLQRLGTERSIPPLSDGLWNQLDDDGNGYVNFSEFCEFTTLYKIDLPLGLDDLLGVDGKAQLGCGVVGCMCRDFHAARRRCKYGAGCYQTKAEHTSQFCHPDDEDWAVASEYADSNMCVCGHKRKLHASTATFTSAVEYPDYWAAPATAGPENEFNSLVTVDGSFMHKLQQLINQTYSDKTTRDRANHSGSWMVPRNFVLTKAWRNENSKLWRKYCVRQHELQREKELTDKSPEAARDLPPYVVYDDIHTSRAWKSLGGSACDTSINEWYLFHGTSGSAAENICKNDFKMRLAGSATGTLYGRGSYFAESITKADEYSKKENDEYTVLLCRVLGGRVRYCAEHTPDPNQLTKDCVEGPFDCIFGDRVKTSGTYREIILFDSENIYPEYVLKYRRGELFKSSSFPGE